MGKLDGKVALITGGSRGLGAGQCRVLAREGATVVVSDVLDDQGSKLVDELKKQDVAAMYLHLDVAVENDWADAVEKIEKHLGRLDILVNNAGSTVRSGVMDLSLQDWNRIISINLTGAFCGSKAVVPLMRKAGAGAIVNISSIAGLGAVVFAAYTASKWGMRGLTKSTAIEFAPWNIRVNSICPGPVDTDFNPSRDPALSSSRALLKRMATVEDVANAVLFVVSDEASFITGIDIPVDGGFSVNAVHWN